VRLRGAFSAPLIHGPGENVDWQFAFFHDRGYAGYVISLRKRSLWPPPAWRRSTFALRPVATPADLHGDMDLIWLPKEGGRFDPTSHLLGAQN
jgi:hypothetical protein